MHKKEVMEKIFGLNPKEGSFAHRTCKLISSGGWDKDLSSKQFVEMYNDGPGKNIKVTSLNALMQPLLKKEIVKVKSTIQGRKKNKIWLPNWINKISRRDTGQANRLTDDIHPEIRKVSENLFYDEHYSQAIEEAFKRVISLVKRKSGRVDLDGYGLMSTVFSTKNPILKLNDLLSKTDRGEQQGWMHLYQGSVLGIRNVKTHGNIIQKDRQRALEYLFFASLLCRRLDETKK